MSAHFTFTQMIPGVTHENDHVATAIITTALIVVLSIAARISLGNGDKATTPSGKISLKAIVEAIVELIVYINDMVLGKEQRAYIATFGSIFIYILISNLMGILPGMSSSTSNINTTVAVGAFSFVLYNLLGIKENGLAYFKHFLGPVWFLIPMMLPIEIISHIVRPLSLGLRLKGNMTGDHTVLGIFLDLVPVGVPMVFYLLGMFVCFVQAFVFTLLSMVYVSMATAHDH